MKQPDSLDVGTQMDVVRHRLSVVREVLDAAYLTFEAGQHRAANNRAYNSIFHTICAVLAKEGASKEITAQQIETAAKILELAEKYLLTESEQQEN